MKKYSIILSTSNIPSYLEMKNILQSDQVQRVKEVTQYTNVNYIYKVWLKSGKKIYLKQAFDYVKVAPAFRAPIDRQEYEYKSLILFKNLWPGQIPRVIRYDKENEIIAMTEAGNNYNVLAAEFNQSKLHLDILPKIAQLTGKLHASTYCSNKMLRPPKANKDHINFIIDFRLKGARKFENKPTKALLSDSLNSRSSIIYGDFASKNILVGPREKIAIVDFQNVVRFDPAFDLGYLLAHWYLEINDRNKERIGISTKEFFKKYRLTFKKYGKIRNTELDGIEQRAIRYIGAIMLHRLSDEGRNPNYFKTKNEPLKIQIARKFLKLYSSKIN
ncbi:MAG: phosphotransferase [Candidatus Dojkabacteria bacterium]|nr:phosphotransferase [Candidatus Dojkabacteria bacterium]